MRVWLPILLVGSAMSAVCVWNQSWLSLGVVIVLTLALLAFFRDPIRRVPRDIGSGDMLSPADGTVSAVFTVDSHEATSGAPASVVRIFLSVLNVHVNRSPFDGEVVGLKHTPGKFLNAQTEESALVNESKLITMRIAGNETIGVRQVSGMIARTIVCPLKPRQRLKRGEKFGMIMFGSTTELILPRPGDVTVHVKKGDKVRGGLTLLATLGKKSATDERG
jgi:phosphatidylserine decarboxylase